MNSYERRLLVEQFNEEYPNRGKLEIYLPTPGSPTKELKPVKDFTDDEKAAYMSQIIFLRNYTPIDKVVTIDPSYDDFDVPDGITKAYLESLG